jgi:xanthine/uracil permease
VSQCEFAIGGSEVSWFVEHIPELLVGGIAFAALIGVVYNCLTEHYQKQERF